MRSTETSHTEEEQGTRKRRGTEYLVKGPCSSSGATDVITSSRFLLSSAMVTSQTAEALISCGLQTPDSQDLNRERLEYESKNGGFALTGGSPAICLQHHASFGLSTTRFSRSGCSTPARQHLLCLSVP